MPSSFISSFFLPGRLVIHAAFVLVVIQKADGHDLSREWRKAEAALQFLQGKLVFLLVFGVLFYPTGEVFLRRMVQRVKILADGLYVQNQFVRG